MDKDEASDDETLSSLNPIDTGINIDGVGAENCKRAHVNVIDDAKVDEWANQWSDEFWHYDICHSIISHKQRKCCDSRHNKLVSPFKIDDIISEAKKNSHASCKKASVILDQLSK